MGLCLEVALKGLVVQRNPALIGEQSLDKSLKTHSLEALFKLAGIDLADSDDELKLVRKLSEAVDWVSRYPIPLKAAYLGKSKYQSEGTLFRNDLDLERFERLLKRIEKCCSDEDEQAHDKA